MFRLIWIISENYFLCLLRLSFLENNLWQISQSNCFLPVWDTQCRIRCSFRLKALLQFGSSHLNGRNPKCNFTCCAKCSFLLNTLSQISHVGTSDLDAPPLAAFVFVVVVVLEWELSVLTIVTLLCGLVVIIAVLAVDFRAVGLDCAAFVMVVAVVVFDNVGSLKTCCLAAGLVSTRSAFGSTFILWNVIAEVSGNGNVIFDGCTFCKVVKCTLPSAAFNWSYWIEK